MEVAYTPVHCIRDIKVLDILCFHRTSSVTLIIRQLNYVKGRHPGRQRAVRSNENTDQAALLRFENQYHLG